MHVTIDVGKSNYCITIMVLNVGGRESNRRLEKTAQHGAS
jgi:hypothetical protein